MQNESVTKKDDSGSVISKILKKKKIRENILVLVLVVVTIFLCASVAWRIWVEPTAKIESFSQINLDLSSGKIVKINITPDAISPEFKVELKDGMLYKAKGPRMDSSDVRLFQSKGVDVIFDEPNFDSRSLPQYLTVAIFAAMLFFSVGSGFSFSSSKKQKSSTKFSDVAGNTEAKNALADVVAYLRDPSKYERMGARFPRGIIMDGAPGTGKTLLGRAVAGEADAHFISCSGADFQSMFVGVSSMKIRSFFAQARKNAPCVVFIDEIDAVGGRRLNEGSAAAREMGSTLNQLLVQMDGFEPNNGVVVVAATNRIELLDPALLRSGRFDRKIHVQLPTLHEREDILRIHGRKFNVEKFDCAHIARSCIGMSGADLENLLNQASLIAVQEGSSVLTTEHGLIARDRMLMGEARYAHSKAFDDHTRRILAAHEAGHAIVGMVNGPDTVTRVSIVPRGQSLGQTMMTPSAERAIQEKSLLIKHVQLLLGGRGAEILVTQTQTTGASDDLSRASDLVMAMICDYGMHNGLLRITEKSSDSMRFQAEKEAEAVLEKCQAQAVEIITTYRSVFDAMMAELLLNEEINEVKMLDFAAMIKLQDFSEFNSDPVHILAE